MYIVFGFNIEAYITSVLSSLGASKNAKRAALAMYFLILLELLFFILLSLFIPIDQMALKFSRPLPAEQLANLHTLLIVLLLRASNFSKIV
ncbi:Na+/phosphate symporter [Anaerococcus nagyae]|nr:Na+/phosphate symporter [Anaerococcus nagyae]